MMVIKTMNMFLEEERKGERFKFLKKKKKKRVFTTYEAGNKIEKVLYKIYNKMHKSVCYTERPNLISK